MSSAFLTSFEVYNAVSFAEGKASAVDLQDLPISHDRRSTPIEQHPAFHSPSAPATTPLLPASVSSTMLDTSYGWNHEVFISSWLAYFTSHNVFKFHPCCHLLLNFLFVKAD